MIDSWVGFINNRKNLGDQISIIKMSNNKIKKIKDKEIVNKRTRTSREKKKIERTNKNLELKGKKSN